MTTRWTFRLLALVVAACTPPTKMAAPSTSKLAVDAEAVLPLVDSPLARDFLKTVATLPTQPKRELYLDKERRRAVTLEEYSRLPANARDGLERREIDYYETKWGSPIAYARVVDLLGKDGLTTLQGTRLLDFGYGTIAHLQTFALLGADAVGVDVDPMLPVLYRGMTGRTATSAGSITLLTGRFPFDPAIRTAVGNGYNVFLSKNTLKRGYIHPERPAPARQLIDLGVSDDTFLSVVHDLLEPGGRAILFNICPRPAPLDKPYVPWADGRSPFARETWEAAGFDVIAFDVDDTATVRALARALQWDRGAEPMDVDHDLFGWYTLARRR